MKRLAKLTIACMLLAAAAAPNAARGQEASAAERFAEQFAARSRSVESILCAFTETRHMSVLADDVVRSGTFRYKRPARMALDFDSGDRIVMTGELFLNRMAGRTTTARMNSNPMLRQMQSIFGACMTGDLEALRQTGRMSVTPREGGYRVVLIPESRAARRYMSSITLDFDAADMTLDRLRMEQPSGDYMLYRFSRKRLNVAIDDAAFDAN